MGNFFFRLYQKLLWLFGFPQGEYITFMLRRQEKRLGVLWWLGLGGIQGWITAVMHSYLDTGLFLILVFPVNNLILLLVWHVVRGK